VIETKINRKEKMSSSNSFADDYSASIKKYEHDEEENCVVGGTAMAKPGDVVAVATETSSTRSLGKKSESALSVLSMHSAMISKRKTDTYDLAEDVYAFMFVCPVLSTPFIFSMYVWAIKIIIYSILVSDINYTEEDDTYKTATAAKFFLIPVALSMQGDLMHAFFCMANLSYSPEVLKISESATKPKLLFSFLLRLADGFFSLAVNFYLMLTTDDTLGVFTNFAALYFLQDIDDVFYGLVELGFFGDGMEHWSTVCKSVTLPRRSDADNKGCGSLRISHLDSVMFFTVFVILLIFYFLFIGYVYLFYGGFDAI